MNFQHFEDRLRLYHDGLSQSIQTDYKRLNIHSTLVSLIDRKGSEISLLSFFTGGRASSIIINLIKQNCFSDVRYEYVVIKITLNYQIFYPYSRVYPYRHCACELRTSICHVKQTSGSVNVAF